MISSLSRHRLKQRVAVGFCCAFVIEGAFSQNAKQEAEYRIEWPPQAAVNRAMNVLASEGWSLRSASLSPCPGKDAPPKGPQCVMVVFEREKK